MDDKIIQNNCEITDLKDDKTDVGKEFNFNLTHARIIFCSGILAVLALFKATNPQVYQKFKEMYNLNFKENSISASEICCSIKDSMCIVREKVKQKINTL